MYKITIFSLIIALLAVNISNGQTVLSDAPVDLEEVAVTAARAPIGMNRAARLVNVISAEEIEASPAASVQDLLEYAVGVDVRQRGEAGTQSDISIRGGTFDQIAVLLNGVNLSSPQTGHLSFDIPVNLSDIARIEVVCGPSSRVFGACAFSGAINIITKNGEETGAEADVYGGMYGLWKVEVAGRHRTERFSQRLSAGHIQTDGYIDNTDSKQTNVCWLSNLTTADADYVFQAGFNGKGYGANGFYTPAYPDQYEATKRFFFSAAATTKGRVRFAPKVYWSRHFDHYELFRYEWPEWYTTPNVHSTQVMGLNINATTTWRMGTTSFGAEFRNEQVKSNVLGELMDEPLDAPFEDYDYTKKADRTNVSYFLEHDVVLPRLTVSVGVLANWNSSLNEEMKFYPGVDLSYRVGENARVYGSWNKALRMPTFIDLYYESVSNLGNVDLKPEESEAFELGVKYNTSQWKWHVAGFYHKGKNMIDWIKETANDEKWQSMNLTKLDNMGFEASACYMPARGVVRRVEVGYSFIDQKKDSEGLLSNYAMNYLKHKLTAGLRHRVAGGLSASWNFRWQDRAGSYTEYVDGAYGVAVEYEPYCVLDLKVEYDWEWLCAYGEVNNLTDSRYYDLGNLPQAGIWAKAGIKVDLK